MAGFSNDSMHESLAKGEFPTGDPNHGAWAVSAMCVANNRNVIDGADKLLGSHELVGVSGGGNGDGLADTGALHGDCMISLLCGGFRVSSGLASAGESGRQRLRAVVDK